MYIIANMPTICRFQQKYKYLRNILAFFVEWSKTKDQQNFKIKSII